MSDPAILLQQSLPRPMHGVCPRNIDGRWFRIECAAAKERAKGICQACEDWNRMEAHECYDADYVQARLTFTQIACICPSCHRFIHINRQGALVQKGIITQAHYDFILLRGRRILAAAGLTKPRAEIDLNRWEDWRMVWNGREYPPKYKTEQEWMNRFEQYEPIYG